MNWLFFYFFIFLGFCFFLGVFGFFYCFLGLNLLWRFCFIFSSIFNRFIFFVFFFLFYRGRRLDNFFNSNSFGTFLFVSKCKYVFFFVKRVFCDLYGRGRGWGWWGSRLYAGVYYFFVLVFWRGRWSGGRYYFYSGFFFFWVFCKLILDGCCVYNRSYILLVESFVFRVFFKLIFYFVDFFGGIRVVYFCCGYWRNWDLYFYFYLVVDLVFLCICYEWLCRGSY